MNSISRSKIYIAALGLNSLFLLNSGCGKSLFSSLSKNDSTESLRKDAVVAMNNENYSEASRKMRTVWSREKTNSNASLFAAALSAEAGYPIFNVALQALQTASNSPSNGTSGATTNANISQDILNKLEQAIGSGNETEESGNLLLEAISVLKEAPNAANATIKLQNCIISGFYAIPALAEIETTSQQLKQNLASLPGQLGATNSATCSASAETINTVSANLANTIQEASYLAERINNVQSVLGTCLPPSSQQSVNQITQKISNLTTNADKGCSIPQNQIIQGVTFPTCLNSTIASTGGNTAASNDGKVAGCELFIHCTGATKCF